MTKKVHFIGICGVGMGAIALLLKEQGWEVSGSDEGSYPPMSDFLKHNGIEIKTPYASLNIPKNVDCIVIGRHAKLAQEENEEVRTAFSHPAPKKSFPEFLGEILKKRRVAVIAGSHGKSTCTALMVWCLLKAGRDPGYFIGALPVTKNFNISHIGTDDLFIVEGDEYPTSHWDMRSKFLHYNAQDLLLTSVAHDHVNIFPTHDAYIAPFKKLVANLSKESTLVSCGSDSALRKLIEDSGKKSVMYSLNGPDGWYAGDIHYGKETSFDLIKDGKTITRLATTLLGKHNIENIVGVSAFLLTKKLITPKELALGVVSFQGLQRRLNLLTNASVVPVYEGFGSSYSKARAAIDAMRLHFPKKRLVVIFEPHTFSWRNKKMLYWYDDVFTGAECVCIYTPPLHGSTSHAQATFEEITKRVQNAGHMVYTATTPKEMLETLQNTMEHNDVVLILTSGYFDGLIDKITKYSERTFARQ